MVEPIPTFPLARIVNIDTPVEEATLNGLSAEEVELCTLKVNVDEVALIPSTAPLSMSVDVPSVVEVSQRVAKPKAPPVRDDEIPRDEVDTHRVEVPAD